MNFTDLHIFSKLDIKFQIGYSQSFYKDTKLFFSPKFYILPMYKSNYDEIFLGIHSYAQ